MRRPALSIQSLIALSIVGMMLILAAVLLWHGARGADRMLVSAVHDTGRQLALTTEERARRLIEPARVVVRLLARGTLVEATTLSRRLEHLPVLAAGLRAHEVASAVYIGYANGDFLLLRSLDGVLDRHLPALPGVDAAAYLVQAITRDAEGERRGEWRLYDDDLHLLARHAMPDYDFDPRTRPWYRRAQEAEGDRLTAPYVFFTTGEIGITLSRRTPEGTAVIGLDASAADLSHEMSVLRLTPGTRLAIVSPQRGVLAYPYLERLLKETPKGPRLARLDELDEPALARLAELGAHELPVRFRQADEAWLGLTLPFRVLGAGESDLLVAIPERELLAEARGLLWQRSLVAAGLVLALLPFGVWTGRRVGRPLRALADQVQALARFDFEGYRGVASPVREVQGLDRALTSMASGISEFRRLTHILGSEPRLETMLVDVLTGLLRITASPHGAIYLVDEADPSRFIRVAEAGEPGGVSPLAEALAAEDEALKTLSREFEARDYLVQPLCNREGHRLGLLLMAQRRGAGVLDDRPWRRFVDEISGAAAVAIDIRRLLEGEQRLLDAIVQLIAGATDAKSPHTGGHCSRVPQLAEMLLDGVDRADTGPFAGVSIDEQQRTTFHLAAWLHDCGKLTTPDEVMEKATKLETRYNRIHEIRTRFEVLWRDADIRYWQGRAEGEDPRALEATREQTRAELQAAFRLVAESNIGGEGLDEERGHRLREVAEWRWWRHFDDRLGVSEDERQRLAREPAVPLPAEEPLLADKPRHRIDWPGRRPPVRPDDPDNRWGFAMQPPEVAGHHGELYNLLVSRGTLNEVERFRIQEHIVQTIMMLESLPWPAWLRRVPAIAGNHHERMDGHGYPRRLVLAEASLEERIMAVADVFEALTAADRPYKPGMTLSCSLTILTDMARSGHLDPEVVGLLLDSGVWRAYAERFLAPAQRDDVDIEALKARAGLPVEPA